MGLKVKSTIFFVYDSTDNFGVFRQTDIMERIGGIFRGSDNHVHFTGYDRTSTPNSYRTEEMAQIIGLMRSMERGDNNGSCR